MTPSDTNSSYFMTKTKIKMKLYVKGMWRNLYPYSISLHIVIQLVGMMTLGDSIDH